MISEASATSALPPSQGGAVGRIVRGLAANLTGNGIMVLIQLISVPVFLAAWGVPTYGAWLVLSAIPTYVALSDFNLATVAANSMVMLEAQERHSEAVELGGHLWSIVTALTGVAVLGAVLVTIAIGSALGVAAISPAEARVVLLALFLQVAVANQYGALDAWYRMRGRYPLGALMRQVGRCVEFGALIVAVFMGARPGMAAVTFLVGSLVGLAVSWAVLRRAVPFSTFRPEVPHLPTFRALLPLGLAYMAFPIGNAMSLQGFTLVLAAIMGAPAVVVFSATRTLTRVAWQIMGSITNAITPELSRAVGGEDLGEARSILRHGSQLALATSVSLSLFLAVIGRWIINVWTHALVEPPFPLLYLLLLDVIFNSFWYVLSSSLIATNRYRSLASIYFVSTLCGLLATVPLATQFGLSGAAVALLGIDLAMIPYVLLASLRTVGDTPSAYFRSLFDLSTHVRTLAWPRHRSL